MIQILKIWFQDSVMLDQREKGVLWQNRGKGPTFNLQFALKYEHTYLSKNIYPFLFFFLQVPNAS